ncbi:MAG: hypothetical protein ICV60_03810 [Pyrinomonadaceae bacterium]|nr:hypothetical protein [Pyrinomonadaceae bacterium]
MKYVFTKTNIALLISAFILGVIAFSISLHRNRSRFPNSFVMKYSDFGSPGSPAELFGQESSQGAETLTNRDDIRVVVYRNVDLTSVKRTYSELGGKYVYRYVEYSQAIAYLDKQIEELKANNSDADYDNLREKLIREYEQSRNRIIERLGP